MVYITLYNQHQIVCLKMEDINTHGMAMICHDSGTMG